MASTPDMLVGFVKACLEKGLPRTEIAAALEKGGWSPREARIALDAFADTAIAVPVPKKRVSSSPRDAFLHLVATAMLYKAAFATGAVFFTLVDHWLPAPGDRALDTFFSVYVLRFAAAVLIVAIPILALVRRTIARDVAKNPTARMTPIYRFLAYFTLLLTTLVMACDLISVIISFLSGDITGRFLLKALIVMAIAGGIYLWYASDMQREEALVDGSAAPDNASLAHPPAWRDWLVRAGALVAVVALVAALWLAGSPARARMLRLDAARVGDLNDIQRNVNQYHARRKKLPDSLEELSNDPETYVSQLADPVTRRLYGYERIDDDTYRLTATFDLPSPSEGEQPPWQRDAFFKHAAGEQSFTIDVPAP